MTEGLLRGIRVVESALLEPNTLGMLLAGLGADVIKVESADGGDYIRDLAWPIVDGVSLLHWHCNRGKASVVLDLRQPEGVETYLDLVRTADIVLEGMRPDALARRGLTFERLTQANPSIVFCSLSGFGSDGPYRDVPSHGLGMDAWSGNAPPGIDEHGRPFIQDITSIGTRVGPLWAGMAVLAAVLRARETGQPCRIEVAQGEAAAAVNWLTIEGEKAYLRPPTEVTGNPSDGGERRALALAGMKEGVRYQYYASKDGHVLFMASERAFWKNFCDAVGRPDLFEGRAGERIADHARGDDDLRAELAEIFASRTTQEWVTLGGAHNVPIVPTNDARSILDDPQFVERVEWLPASRYGADLLPLPIRVHGERLPDTRPAPRYGEHTDEVLRDVLHYDDERIARLRGLGVLGAVTDQ